MKNLNPWISRYERFTSLAAIKKAATVFCNPLGDLRHESPELAAARIECVLTKIFIPTDRVCALMQAEIARAHAHAVLYYPDRQTTMANAYALKYEGDGYMPTCITGLAGSGKTQLLRAMGRVLGPPTQIKLGPDHGEVPLNTFTTISIGSQRSISQILRPLARPEVILGNIRVSEMDLIEDCARWQTQTGSCLLGVDELQFLAQSSDATTQVTKVLLAFQKVMKPWFFIANYSLCEKLKSRPQEATQRLLSRPRVIHPDLPDSKDWLALIDEYEKLLSETIGSEIFLEKAQLWNYTGGLKRLLVLLIKNSYLTARMRGNRKVSWTDVTSTYNSIDYQLNRRDIEELIANSIQGGALRQHLKCPFTEADIEEMESYKNQLRLVRAKRLSAAAVRSTLNEADLKILDKLQEPKSTPKNSSRTNVVRISKSKISAKSLAESARRYADASLDSSLDK